MSADTATAPPQLRPLALGEILDVAIKLVRRSFKALALAVVVVAAAVAVLEVVLVFSTTTYDSALGGRTAVSDAASVAAGVIGVVLLMVAYVLATVACFRAVADAYLHGAWRTIRTGSSSRRPRAWSWRSTWRGSARASPRA